MYACTDRNSVPSRWIDGGRSRLLFLPLSGLLRRDFLLYGQQFKTEGSFVRMQSRVVCLLVTCLTYDAGSEGRMYVGSLSRDLYRVLCICLFICWMMNTDDVTLGML